MSTFNFKNWIFVFGILCNACTSTRAQGYEKAEGLETCHSNECVQISNWFTKVIDSDVRPCDDFYAYACGKVIKETKIPEGWDAVNTVNSVVAIMTKSLIKSLKTKKPNDPDVVKKAKSFFASCNSEDEIANLGVVPLTILLKNLNLPLRPPYLGALEMKDGFGTLIGKMRQYLFVNFPFRVDIGVDPEDRNKSRLEILVPESDRNSKIPYRPPTPSTPKSEPPTEPLNGPLPTTSNGPNPVKKDKTEEKKAAAPLKKLNPKVSRNKSFSMVTRSLNDPPTSPVRAKVVKKKPPSSRPKLKGNGEGEEMKRTKRKVSTKQIVPTKAVKKNPEEENENEDEGEMKLEDVKTSDRLKKKGGTPTGKSAAAKNNTKKPSQKSANEQKGKKLIRDKGDEEEEEEKIKKPTPRKTIQKKPEEGKIKKPTPKKAIQKKPTEEVEIEDNSEIKEEKVVDEDESQETKKPIPEKKEKATKGKGTIEEEEEKTETEVVEKKVEDTQTNVQEEEGSADKKNESTATLEITEDENQPLIEYMMKVANYLYKETNIKLLESKKDSLRQKVTAVAKLLHKIEKMTIEAIEDQGDNGKEMTIQQLHELTLSFDTRTDKQQPLIDWSNFIRELLSYHPNIQHQFLEEGRKIYISNLNYLKSVLELLHETDPRVFYCALWWYAVRSVVLDLPDNLRIFEYDYKKQAKIYNAPREEYCMLSTVNAYGYAAAYDFVIDEKTNQNIKEATNLFSFIYGPLISMIQNSSILDPRTIMAAIAKFDSGNHTFGTPTQLNSVKGLNDTFRSTIFHEYNYFFSRFFQAYEAVRSQMGLLDSSLSVGIGSPLSTKSVFNVQLNVQMVPLAHSQFPFMGNGLTSITMGMITVPFLQQAFHHFDVLANEYNLWGEKENWWAKKSLKNFYAQAECFIDAYNKECFDGAGCVDGKRTLHENVADHGALKSMIQAYKNFQKTTKEPRLMDFESFSHLRLLTLSFAVSLCEIQTPEKLWETLKTSKFAPPSVRVNQVMKNLPEFSEIWGCDANDPMNPSDKCQVWGFIEESKRKFVKND